MNKMPELIVMLTYNDFTVANAADIFEECKGSKARFWGFKEHSLPQNQMKKLYARMKECGYTTFLEVVSYSEAEGLEGAKIAVECGCDVLMGTVFFDTINNYCKEHDIKYMPFVGDVMGRPSVLNGSIADMIEEARRYISKGAYGIDLLGYRFTGDAAKLNETVVKGIEAPVCLAGSIDSLKKLDEVTKESPWAFTIGSAFFDKKFGDTFLEQINRVCDYMKEQP